MALSLARSGDPDERWQLEKGILAVATATARAGIAALPPWVNTLAFPPQLNFPATRRED